MAGFRDGRYGSLTTVFAAGRTERLRQASLLTRQMPVSIASAGLYDAGGTPPREWAGLGVHLQ